MLAFLADGVLAYPPRNKQPAPHSKLLDTVCIYYINANPFGIA